jgi:NADPH:quinone reductase-like Zn-dependent oxidoreductase
MPNALVVKEYGGPENQQFVDLPTPEPGPGQLRVSVRAAGVNPADWKVRRGLRRDPAVTPPFPLGREVAGVVEAVGGNVRDFTVGDEVFATPLTGGFRTETLLDAATTARKPARVSFDDAATLPIAAGTAWDALVQLDLPAGATLLILGIGGGVGVAAAQIARHRGLVVVGTASAAKHRFVESLGAVAVAYGDGVAERIRAAAPDGIQAILDLVGGDALRDAAPLLDDRTRLLTAADRPTAAELGGAGVQRARTAAVFEQVAALVADGALDPKVTEVFPLERADEALAVVESGHTRGKVVVRPT